MLCNFLSEIFEMKSFILQMGRNRWRVILISNKNVGYDVWSQCWSEYVTHVGTFVLGLLQGGGHHPLLHSVFLLICRLLFTDVPWTAAEYNSNYFSIVSFLCQ